jgi:hypothetical protein
VNHHRHKPASHGRHHAADPSLMSRCMYIHQR